MRERSTERTSLYPHANSGERRIEHLGDGCRARPARNKTARNRGSVAASASRQVVDSPALKRANNAPHLRVKDDCQNVETRTSEMPCRKRNGSRCTKSRTADRTDSPQKDSSREHGAPRLSDAEKVPYLRKGPQAGQLAIT